jgi:hypothetical protein
MATGKTTTTAGEERVLEVVSSPENERRPRLVATSRQRKTSPDAPGDSVAPDEIRIRAYFLSLARGERPPDPVDDWVRAESELTTGKRSANTRG